MSNNENIRGRRSKDIIFIDKDFIINDKTFNDVITPFINSDFKTLENMKGVDAYMSSREKEND